MRILLATGLLLVGLSACTPNAGSGSTSATATGATATSSAATIATGYAGGSVSAADVAEADAFLRRVLTETYSSPPAQTPAERAASEAEGERQRTMTAAQYADVEAAQNAPIYSLAFVDLMRRDRLSTEPGSMGVLEVQILCGCNDDSLIQMVSTEASARPDGRVDVLAHLNSGPTRPFDRRFIMARTPQGWQIDDAAGTEAGEVSLRARLERGVPEQEAAMRAGSASASGRQP